MLLAFIFVFPPVARPGFYPASTERWICCCGWVSLECVSVLVRLYIQVPLRVRGGGTGLDQSK